MIKLVISAERGTSEAGIVFLYTARKYRFECMRGVFESRSIQSLVCFVAIGHCLSCHTFHVYFRFFQHLKKCHRFRLYGIYSHFLVSHLFVALWHRTSNYLWS